jgi:hypothetical protein
MSQHLIRGIRELLQKIRIGQPMNHEYDLKSSKYEATVIQAEHGVQ